MRLASCSFIVGFLLVGIGVACSSSDSSGTTGSSCSCTVSNNGASATLQCGASQCVSGTTYACSSSAQISPGAPCVPASNTMTGQPTSSSSSSGTTTSSSSSSSGAAATTVPCAYHDFDKDVDVTTCNAATQYCIRSYAHGEEPGSTNVCVPLPSGCTGCDCASDNAEAAWQAAEQNSNNCSNTTDLCNDSNGAVIVDCVK